jgi:hypothetical protein
MKRILPLQHESTPLQSFIREIQAPAEQDARNDEFPGASVDEQPPSISPPAVSQCHPILDRSSPLENGPVPDPPQCSVLRWWWSAVTCA